MRPEPVNHGAWSRLVIPGCLLMAALVHGRALAVFFTSPDDLIHLQQAAGLLPTPPSPFRYLSQVLYFRAMFGIFGPHPVPFHAVTLVVHLANICLVVALSRSLGAGHFVSTAAAALFGVFPLFSTLLSSAVGINDELAFALALGSLLTLRLKSWAGVALPSLLFTLGMLCKESIIGLPFLAFMTPGDSLRSKVVRVAPLLGIALAFGILFGALRPSGLAPDRVIYAIEFGPNVFHNLMTYVGWCVNLTSPLPDLVSSYDPQAWKVGLWVMLGAMGSAVFLGGKEPSIRIGLVWFLLGLLPVLPLQLQTYRHYLYPAVPGLALVVVGSALVLVEWLARLAPRSTPTPAVARVVVVLGILAYAFVAEQMVQRRFEIRVRGTDLALDPVHRRREVAEHAIRSIGSSLNRPGKFVAILMPEGVGRVFGSRSGQEYPRVAAGQRPYNLLEESLDHGRALKLFFPSIDSVAFVRRWTRAYDDFDLFLPHRGGNLAGVGKGPEAHREVARWMLEQRWYPQARDHLGNVLEVYPTDAVLRLAYSTALFKSGDRARAVEELEKIVRTAPGDSSASAARAILAGLKSSGPR